MLVIRQTWRMLHVLTGLSSWSVWLLTNSAAGALVLTGGGLGGCRSVCAKTGAAGEVRLTYSDRSISNWGAQEPTNQSTAQHSIARAALQSLQVMRRRQVKTAEAAAKWRVDTHTRTHRWWLLEANEEKHTGADWHQPNSVYSARDFTSAQHFKNPDFSRFFHNVYTVVL